MIETKGPVTSRMFITSLYPGTFIFALSQFTLQIPRFNHPNNTFHHVPYGAGFPFMMPPPMPSGIGPTHPFFQHQNQGTVIAPPATLNMYQVQEEDENHMDKKI